METLFVYKNMNRMIPMIIIVTIIIDNGDLLLNRSGPYLASKRFFLSSACSIMPTSSWIVFSMAYDLGL